MVKKGRKGKSQKATGEKEGEIHGCRNRFQCFTLLLILCFFVMSCGRQGKEITNTEAEAERFESSGTQINEEAETEKEADAGAGVHQENTGVITVYATEEPKLSEEEIPVLYTDDLSLLHQMGQADCNYAYRDGMVYYRQYHGNSFEEWGLWAYYDPVEGTEKEIVCIDAQGNKSVLFQDRGYGNIYLSGDRFFMTERVPLESGGYSEHIYSVDMQGRNRLDYGNGSIVAFDRDRNILILNMRREDNWRGTFAVLDCMGNETFPLIVDSFDSLEFHAYQNGWCYFTAYQAEGRADGIGRVFAVSLEGEQKEILALVSGRETLEPDGYGEYICQMGIAKDRLYIVFGGYAGSGNFYQGGRLITVKLDGSDYRAIDSYQDFYYVCYDEDRPLLYIPHSFQANDGKEYETTVWDVEANILYPSNFPWQLISQVQAQDALVYQSHMACIPLCAWGNEEINVYALPDDSGRILQVATGINNKIAKREEPEADYVNYKHWYYADGFLYFEVEYNQYAEEYSIGWRDGYHRLQTDVYRMKLDEGETELLYSY